MKFTFVILMTVLLGMNLIAQPLFNPSAIAKYDQKHNQGILLDESESNPEDMALTDNLSLENRIYNDDYSNYQEQVVRQPYSLPFVENWSSGNFTANQWTAQGNWWVYSGTGNPPPSALFSYTPTQTNYSFNLTSWDIDGESVSVVLAEFDLLLNLVNNPTLEQLSFEVFNGTAWQSIATFNNLGGNIPRTRYIYDISSHSAERVFKIRFRAHGVNTTWLDFWSIDNIILSSPINIPFTENWSSGNFSENQWTAEYSWGISPDNGNPSPTARFLYDYNLSNYSRSLRSFNLDARNLNVINARFDIYLSNYNTVSVEQLSFEVFDGTTWQTIATFNNQQGNIPWTTVNYDISSHAANRIFQVRFRAHGLHSYNINHWYVDNIMIATVSSIIDQFPYFEDFETGSEHWTSGAISGADHWEVGTPGQIYINSAHSGTNAWMTRLTANYDNGANSWLMSPEFDFSVLDYPYLSLWLNIACEYGWDALILEASTDHGSSWQHVIGSSGFYNNYEDWGPIPSPKWSGYTYFWTQFETSLIDFAHEDSVILRFRFGSDSSVISEGVAIDDLQIWNYAPSSIAVTPTQINETLLQSTSLTIPLTITNDGFGELDFTIFISELRGETSTQGSIRSIDHMEKSNRPGNLYERRTESRDIFRGSPSQSKDIRIEFDEQTGLLRDKAQSDLQSQNDLISVLELEEYPDWLIVAPLSGTVDPGQSIIVDVMLDATDMPLGLHTAEIIINHNASGNDVIIPVTMIVYSDEPLTLPFTEDWSSGNHLTNQWTIEGNWTIYAGLGNPPPAARFFYNPSYNDYSFDLLSTEIDATGVNNITAQFDVYLSNYNLSTTEQLSFEVFDGSVWQTVANFNNQGGDIPWTTLVVDISPHATNRIFKIRFRAHGQYSWNINWWLIDNIIIETDDPIELEAPVVAISIVAGNLFLSWDDVEGANSYKILVSEDPYAGEWDEIAIVSEPGYTDMIFFGRRFYRVVSSSEEIDSMQLIIPSGDRRRTDPLIRR